SKEPTTPAGAGATVRKNRKVLLLGSGFVAAPLVDYLLRTEGNGVTIASNVHDEAARLSRGRAAAPVVPLDVHDAAALSRLVRAHDAVVSFVPAPLHPAVAEVCIAEKTNLVTASYVSPAMSALHDRAVAAGVTLLNEVGLDPGIDHMTAARRFDELRLRGDGSRLRSFVSWCGGLPAPEASDNPLAYKFSWSPRGVLLAGLNSATFRRDGK
ncbi:hypothetical protein HK405_001246, partial [Cladochytrium tenue]